MTMLAPFATSRGNSSVIKILLAEASGPMSTDAEAALETKFPDKKRSMGIAVEPGSPSSVANASAEPEKVLFNVAAAVNVDSAAAN
jgi:hypothetical protein